MTIDGLIETLEKLKKQYGNEEIRINYLSENGDDYKSITSPIVGVFKDHENDVVSLIGTDNEKTYKELISSVKNIQSL